MDTLHRTAPRRDGLVEVIDRLLKSRDPEVPAGDTFDRVDYRLGIVFACYDTPDDPENDPAMHVRDLLTDIIHLCESKGWSLENELAGAIDMAQQEAAEWEEREERRRDDDVAMHERSLMEPSRSVSGEW